MGNKARQSYAKKRSRSLGFSLVELMVSVSLIGVLAAIGIPSYNRIRVKAYQSEAKAHLAGIYTAEKSFFFQYNAYSSSLKAIGYAPLGRNRYNAGFGGYPISTGSDYVGSPSDNMTTRSICSGTYGNGSSNDCSIIIPVPPIPSTANSSDSRFTAASVGFEDSMAEQNYHRTSFGMIAQLLLFGDTSKAVFMNPNPDVFEHCALRTASAKSWGINQDKIISTTQIPPDYTPQPADCRVRADGGGGGATDVFRAD